MELTSVTIANGAVSTDMVAGMGSSKSGSGSTSANGSSSTYSTRVVVARGVVEVTVLVVLGSSETSARVLAIADVAEATCGASTNVLGYTLELVVPLFATAEDAALRLELVHSHSG